MNKYSDEYYVALARALSDKSTCLRRKVGAILVQKNEIISVGVNGAPIEIGSCKSCYRLDNNIPSGSMLDHCYAIHAEVRAIIFALKNGYDLKSSTLYLNCSPCTSCAKIILCNKIERVVASFKYDADFSLKLLKEVGINLNFVSDSYVLTDEDELTLSRHKNNLLI